MAGSSPARGGLASVQKEVRKLAKRLDQLEKLVRSRPRAAGLDADLRAELRAWDAASDEALARVEKQAK